MARLATLEAALVRGEISAQELCEQALLAADHHAGLNAVVHLDAESAREQARAADQRRAAGKAGPLTGIPFFHKDIFCVRGQPVSCASRMLKGFVAPYSSTVHQRLEDAGAVLLGTANMDEFAMGSSNETSLYGPVHNPWRQDRVPGGSSGGSAALVAARVVPFTTGTDTGGSIRQPAALCGVTGIKPTYGRISRWGQIAFASSLDQAGVLAESAADCARLLQVLAGHDPQDATCSDAPVDDYSARLDLPLEGLRIGLPRQYFDAGLDAATGNACQQAVAELESRGATLVDVDLPSSALAIAAYYVIAPAEASSNLARYDGARYGHRCEQPTSLSDLYARSRNEGFGEEVKRRILIGTYVLSSGYYDAYYLTAQKARRAISMDFARVFEQVDVIAGPTTPGPAFRLGERADSPTQMYLSDLYTVAANLAGLPAMSVPAGFSDGLPVGLQLIGAHFSEARLLQLGHALQQLTDWHLRQPPGEAAT